MPSLLKDSPGNLVPPLSSSNTGASTPLHPVSGNQGGGAPNLAQAAAIARITNATNANINSRAAPIQNMQTQALLNQQRLTNAQSAIQASARSEREMSAGSDSKRRRPTGSIGPLPTANSSLGRQGSVGPGTPKPSTPGSRAGSVGPRHALTVKKAKPQQPLRKAALTAKSGVNKKRRKGVQELHHPRQPRMRAWLATLAQRMKRCLVSLEKEMRRSLMIQNTASASASALAIWWRATTTTASINGSTGNVWGSRRSRWGIGCALSARSSRRRRSSGCDRGVAHCRYAVGAGEASATATANGAPAQVHGFCYIPS